MDSTDGTNQYETAPLLEHPGDVAPRAQATTAQSIQSEARFWTIIAILILVPISYYIAEASQIRFFELTSCRNYYREHNASRIGPDGSVPEQWCKESKIGEEVAYITSWQPSFDLLTSMPDGDTLNRGWQLLTKTHRFSSKRLDPTVTS